MMAKTRSRAEIYSDHTNPIQALWGGAESKHVDEYADEAGVECGWWVWMSAYVMCASVSVPERWRGEGSGEVEEERSEERQQRMLFMAFMLNEVHPNVR